MSSYRQFEPEKYEPELTAILTELGALQDFDGATLQKILRRYPKDGTGLFSKSELVRGFRRFQSSLEIAHDSVQFLERLQMKPIRTLSGVAPVTILTKPYPCPGRCIFCPSDVRMPKSYLSDEPGAQRAAQHQFDPYLQTFSRLMAYHHNGHPVDKVELIILGGTWSFYPEEYQIWCVKRCFDAMNDFSTAGEQKLPDQTISIDFRSLEEKIDGRSISRNYNTIVSEFTESLSEDPSLEAADWQELEAAQKTNEATEARCVGLVVETRPDHLSLDEAVRIRRLGATKVQIGFQSLSDEVLAMNNRGHDVAASRRAVKILRGAGFKIHGHWMPNLYGSSPTADVADFERLFSDPGFRPDELKVYPCSLIETAELMAYYERGTWRPYEHDELLHVLTECMLRTPRYCRLTRVIRDIPGTDIVDGNRTTNFRELAERELESRGSQSSDIRAREVRGETNDPKDLSLKETRYKTGLGQEHFLEFVTRDDRIAAFLRLSLPAEKIGIPEIESAAMIREVHVYGRLVAVGDRRHGPSQHRGLGTRLIARAEEIADRAGFGCLAVISSIGTRHYYRKQGFEDGALYQSKLLGRSPVTAQSQSR